ncbi:MAG: DUF1749 domain-containing protein [bacterium]|nr:DUF1749 domain-containing protein [bacterium]
MLPVYLTKIKTGDGLVLEGIVIEPKNKSQTALVWLHGLSSKFSSGQTLIKELSSVCQKAGIGYFKFNNRGHDVADVEDIGMIGAGFEKFEDCILDIKAVIQFAKKLGYKNIILAGHSTGANKALYYVYKTKDRAVKKLILLGPICDLTAMAKKIGQKELDRRVKIVQEIKNKNPKTLAPLEFGLYSADRYLSLHTPGSAEDVFPYYNPEAGWKELKSVKIPVAVIVGGKDEYLDRPTVKFIEIFAKKAQATERFAGIIIKGADHGFRKKEKEVSEEMISFTKNGL